MSPGERRGGQRQCRGENRQDTEAVTVAVAGSVGCAGCSARVGVAGSGVPVGVGVGVDVVVVGANAGVVVAVAVGVAVVPPTCTVAVREAASTPLPAAVTV